MSLDLRFPDITQSAHLLASSYKLVAGIYRYLYKPGSGTGLCQFVHSVNAIH
jgi:hypothetical protein